MNLALQTEQFCLMVWVEGGALLAGAGGDQTWHMPLFHTPKPHRFDTNAYYFLF